MESFAVQTKKRLFAKKLKSSCCRRAFLMGFLSVLLEKSGDEYKIALPFEELKEPLTKMIREQCGRLCRSDVDKRLKREVLIFDGSTVDAMIGDAVQTLSLERLLPKACAQCISVFLRGVFIAGGRMIPPEKGYSLELDCRQSLPLISSVLENENVPFRHAVRRGREYLYLKKSLSIEDFFVLIGDQELSFTLMNEKIARQFRNDANRVASCESNNIARTVTAAGGCIDLIERLIAAEKLSLLPKELQETALMRLEHREASLETLARMMVPPLTKSGINHRLQKMMTMATRILEEETK